MSSVVEQGFCKLQVSPNPVQGLCRYYDMPKKQMIDKNGNTWEWEETPEVVKAVKKLHESSNAVKRKVEVDNITWTDVFDKLEYDRLQKTFTVIAPK